MIKRSTGVIPIKAKSCLIYMTQILIKYLFPKKNLMVKKTSFKYFLGYNDDDDVIRPLCIKLSQIISYVKCFDSNKKMYFKVNDNKLLKKVY